MKFGKARHLAGWIDNIAVLKLVFAAGLSILAFAGAFWHWKGIVYSNGEAYVSFGNALYFSFVTFTSLGYGDIVPRGYGKALACAEVVCGLAFLGIGIAKLSSARQSYHLGQLYARDAQQRFEDFVISLRESLKAYRIAVDSLSSGKALAVAAGSMHLQLDVLLRRIRTYLSFEVDNGDLLNRMPIGPAAKLLKCCTKLLAHVVRVGTFSESIHSEKQRHHAKRVVNEMLRIARLVSTSCSDPALSSEAARLERACTSSQEALQFATTRVAAAAAARRELWVKKDAH